MMVTPDSAAREYSFDYSDDPAVLIFADLPSARAAACDAVQAVGGRVNAALPLADALARIQAQATCGMVLVEVSEDGGDVLDALLDALDAAARSGRHGSIVIVPAHLIDVAAARAGHGDVTLLCDPDPFERVAAIAAALAHRQHQLSDVNAEGSGTRLKELSEEVSRIAKALATMASEEMTRPSSMPMPQGEPGGWPVDAGLIRSLIRARRLRSQFFPADLFADPAWDMLLDLTAARLEGRAVAVSSLCIASAVPPTTALRWIKTLTDAKLFARVADNTDGRRVFIELTEPAATGMIAYLAALQRVLAVRL